MGDNKKQCDSSTSSCVSSSSPGLSVVNANDINISQPQEDQNESTKLQFSLYYSITDEKEFTFENQLNAISSYLKDIFSLVQNLHNPYAFKKDLAKVMLNMLMPRIDEEAGSLVEVNVDVCDRAFVKCSDLKTNVDNFSLSFGDKAKERLDEGLNYLYQTIKHNKSEVYINVGGHHQLKDFVFAACSLFGESIGNRTRNKKQYKNGKIKFKSETRKDILDYVENKWKPLFDDLKNKGWSFKLIYVCLNECTKVYVMPKIQKEHGLKAFWNHLTENWTDEDSNDILEFVPIIGAKVIYDRYVSPKEDIGFVDVVVVGSSLILAPFFGIARKLEDKSLTVVNLGHFVFTTLSFVPHPALYIGAPVADILLHIYEICECYQNKDRRGVVNHLKNCFLDVLMIIPSLVELKARKLTRLIRGIEESEKAAKIQKLERDAKIAEDKARQLEKEANNASINSKDWHEKRFQAQQLKSEAYAYREQAGLIESGASERAVNSYKWQKEQEHIINAQEHAARMEPIGSVHASNLRYLAAERRSALIAEKSNYYEYLSHDALNNNWSQIGKNSPIVLTKEYIYYKDLLKRNNEKASSYLLSIDTKGKGYYVHKAASIYSKVFTFEGLAEDAYDYGVCVNNNKEGLPKNTNDIDEWNWTDIFLEALFEAAIDLVFLPAEIVAFFASIESPKPIYDENEMRQYVQDNYGMVYVPED